MKKQPAWLGSRDGAWPSVEVSGAIERAESEWLHTNGAGAYSMSTIALMHTRRHHGALVAALPPPLGRHVIVSHADLTLTVENDRRSYRLATHQFPDVAPTPGYRNLLSFAQDPIPRWVFRTGSGTLERTLCLVRGENAVIMGYTWSGVGPARISLRPLMPLRPVNSLMHEHGGMEQLVALRPGAVELRPVERLPAIFFAHDGVFMGGPDWWRRFEYLADRGEHAEFQEDMWTPGVFELPLEPGRTSYLVASVGKLLDRPPAELVMEACEAISREALGVGRPAAVRLLSVAAEQFCLDAAKPPMIIAGYPWHAPYTRDFLLALPGLTLARGRVDLAARALPTLLASQHGGFLPEFLAEQGQPRPKPLPDATLWLYEVARLMLPELGAEHAPLKRQLYNALVRSFARLRGGFRRWGWLSNDGLLVNGAEDVALTWMDAHVGAEPVTPRRGIAIEQQALFTQATGTLATLADEAGNLKLAEACREAGVKARAAFRIRFWCHDTDFPYDCVSESRDAQDAWVDPSIRPNALIALAVDPSLFEEWQARAIVARVKAELLTPRGIRSLSPLDPRYVSQFAGTLQEKELGYHQGTAWTHLLGFYVRAAIRVAPDDEELRDELRQVIEGALDGSVILGQIAQLADGDMPHRARGCPAQATSVAELIRALVVDLGHLNMASRDLADLGYRRIVILLVSLVVVPTFLLVSLGVILLFLGEAQLNLLMGILVMALSGAAVTGVILVWVFVRREAGLSRLQSDFVSKVSHELKTPLTSIRLFSETLALRRGDPSAEQKCIEGLERETTRLQELIDRLLDWGRMESGRREFVIRQTDLRSILDNALDAFETYRHQRSVDLSVDMPRDSLHVLADRGAVSDALLNLLTNAYKYGGDPVKVNVAVEEGDGFVRVKVTDNGAGIPITEHKRIFQKFYRVDDRLSREREGSGLGLAIVKHVMKAHKGRVELVSHPGRGSTFSLVLPKA